MIAGGRHGTACALVVLIGCSEPTSFSIELLFGDARPRSDHGLELELTLAPAASPADGLWTRRAELHLDAPFSIAGLPAGDDHVLHAIVRDPQRVLYAGDSAPFTLRPGAVPSEPVRVMLVRAPVVARVLRVVPTPAAGGDLFPVTWPGRASVDDIAAVDDRAVEATREPWWRASEPSASPPARALGASAHDAVRGRVVLFGGRGAAGALGDTWEWDGDRWIEQPVQPGGAPRRRHGHAMAFFAARNRTVLFSGSVTDPLGDRLPPDLWEWDGVRWTVAAVEGTSPPGRFGHALAYDPRRGRIVLFGGSTVTATGAEVALGDTWDWDGGRWRRIEGRGPPGRFGHTLTADPTRGTLVLVGGTTHTGGDLEDAWELDGDTWRAIATTTPAPRVRFAGASPSARGVIVVGGERGDAPSAEVWLLESGEWRALTALPLAVSGAIVSRDARSGRTLVHAGDQAPSRPTARTWVLDGGAWLERERCVTSPPARKSAGAAVDRRRGRTVIFGGEGSSTLLDDTWEWDGRCWSRAGEGNEAPAPRKDLAMAYDAARARVVLFGGEGYGRTLYGDTWEWDGAAWSRTSTGGPAPRTRHAMAYDEGIARVIVAGGIARSGDAEVVSSETWQLEAQGWQRIPSGDLQGRYNHGLAYDPGSLSVLAFGGVSDSATFVDGLLALGMHTRAWGAVTTPAPEPEVRTAAGLTTDFAAKRVLLSGGLAPAARYLSDVWEWNEDRWRRIIPAGTPPAARYGHVFIAGGDALAFGGRLDGSTAGDTWILEQPRADDRPGVLVELDWLEAAGDVYDAPTEIAELQVDARGELEELLLWDARAATWVPIERGTLAASDRRFELGAARTIHLLAGSRGARTALDAALVTIRPRKAER